MTLSITVWLIKLCTAQASTARARAWPWASSAIDFINPRCLHMWPFRWPECELITACPAQPSRFDKLTKWPPTRVHEHDFIKARAQTYLLGAWSFCGDLGSPSCPSLPSRISPSQGSQGRYPTPKRQSSKSQVIDPILIPEARLRCRRWHSWEMRVSVESG